MGSAAEDAVERLRRVEGLAVVSGVWLIVAHLAAIPFVWVGVGPIDALFESMSGLTATGATILRDFADYGRAIFFWRALTHWVGGMGVIALFVAILPRLSIGGRELFFAESPGPSEDKVSPQIRRTAALLWRPLLVGEVLFDRDVHAVLESYEGEGRLRYTGMSNVRVQAVEKMKSDLVGFLPISLALMAVVLYGIFRSVRATLLPLRSPGIHG